MSNALANPRDRTRAVMIEVRDQLQKKRKILASLLPREITPERMQAIVLTSFQKNPGLLNCDPNSILGCVYESAKMGLEPDTGAQLAHIIPYKGKATFQLGYRGLMLLARRALGKDTALGASEVRKNDIFEHTEFPPDLKHSVPRVDGVPMSEEERGPIVAAYAWCRFPDGYQQFRVCYADEIKRARAASASARGGSSPWNTHESSMVQKTALKRLSKLLPMPDLAGHAIMMDDSAEDGRDQRMSETWDAIGTDDSIEVTQVQEETNDG